MEILKFPNIYCSCLRVIYRFSFFLLGVFSQLSFLRAIPIKVLYLFRSSWTYFKRFHLSNCWQAPSCTSPKTRLLLPEAQNLRGSQEHLPLPIPQLLWRGGCHTTNLPSQGTCEWKEGLLRWAEPDNRKLRTDDEVRLWEVTSWTLHLAGMMSNGGVERKPRIQVSTIPINTGHMYSQNLVEDHEKFLPVLCIKHRYL